jgi:cell division protein FtsI (penicillin-binding protein 3)
MAGAVFHQISEGIMAKYMKVAIEDAHDSTSILVPEVKNGNMLAADYVLNQLNVKTLGGWGGNYADGTPVWGRSESNRREVRLTEQKLPKNSMPDVTGMGARDAVYMLETRGVKVHLSGTGRVKTQSIPFGATLHEGMTCQLKLD